MHLQEVHPLNPMLFTLAPNLYKMDSSALRDDLVIGIIISGINDYFIIYFILLFIYLEDYFNHNNCLSKLVIFILNPYTM